MKTRNIIMIIVAIVLAGILALLPEKDNSKPELDLEQLHYELNKDTRFLSTDVIADLLVNQDPSLLLIDIRTKEEFNKFSLPGAINIPLENILDEEFASYFGQSFTKNVLYGNGTVMADQAWTILRRLNYENLYVMDGGLNEWVSTILRPSLPSITEIDDDVRDLYQFRKAASQYFGGGEGETSVKKTEAPKVVVKRKRVESGVAGGC